MSSTEARVIHRGACFAGKPAPTWIALAFRLGTTVAPSVFSGFKHHSISPLQQRALCARRFIDCADDYYRATRMLAKLNRPL